MKDIAYYDGVTGTSDTLVVPFNDRGHFFGDGIYDAALGANKTVFLADEHIDRFYGGAREVGIKVPMGKEELSALLTDLLAQVDGDVQFVYWQVTRGVAPRDHTYDEDMQGKLWVYIKSYSVKTAFDDIDLITAEDKRYQYNYIKTLNLLPAVMYSQQAKQAGAGEAILYRGDIVTECAHSNVSILKDGKLYSHPNDEFILRGISKTHLIQACQRLGIPVIEKPFTLDQLFDADEVLVTSTSKLCNRGAHIDGKPVGHKAEDLCQALQEEIKQEFLVSTGLPALL